MTVFHAKVMESHGAEETCQVLPEESDYQIADKQISGVGWGRRIVKNTDTCAKRGTDQSVKFRPSVVIWRLPRGGPAIIAG